MNKMLAEFIGTFTLVLFGCGAAVIAGPAVGATTVGVLGIAFAFGLAIVAMAYGIGPVSGCHVNPAVSVGVWIAGRMPTGEMIQYVIAQCLGAIAGTAVLYLIMSGKASGWDGGLGANGWGPGYLGEYNIALGADLRGGRDLPLPRHHPRRDAEGDAAPHRRLRRPGDRPDARRDPHRRHQRHRRLGEPGAEPRPGAVRRRHRARAALAVHRRAAGRRDRSPASSTGRACSGATSRPVRVRAPRLARRPTVRAHCWVQYCCMPDVSCCFSVAMRWV